MGSISKKLAKLKQKPKTGRPNLEDLREAYWGVTSAKTAAQQRPYVMGLLSVAGSIAKQLGVTPEEVTKAVFTFEEKP